jgi:hypothetical protein
MSGIIFVVTLIALLFGVGIWAWKRAADLQAEAHQREAAALQLLLIKPTTTEQASAASNTAFPPANSSFPDRDRSRASTAAVAPKATQTVQDNPITITIGDIIIIERMIEIEPEPVPEAPVTLTAPTKIPTPASALANLPLRDLVLSFYEARGYRQEWAAPDIRPVELVLRNRHDHDRSYAFVHWQHPSRLDGPGLSRLARELSALGFKRAIVAVERGFDDAAIEAAKKFNLRLYDNAVIQGKILELAPELQAKLAGMSKARAQKRTA